MKIKGVIFDMDGTLVNSLMFWEDMWRQIGRKYLNEEDYHAPEAIDRSVRTMILSDAMAYIGEELHIDAPAEELIEFGGRGVVDFYMNVATIKQGAYELIDHLRASGIKIGIATATDMKYVRAALESCKLEGLFDFIISCADIGVGKDKPDIYLKARDILGFDERDICVVEDSYVALETARKAGFQTVGVFDRYNFGQDRLKAASDIYLGEGQGLEALVERIEGIDDKGKQ